ncbi:MAG TPA: hypothetical protein PLP09_11590 [Petrotogaceae bacterium]|nr:hypothetical protein [Petrotogaceae bacterium]
MEYKFNKDLKQLIKEKEVDIKKISESIKTTEYTVNKLIENDLSDFSYIQLKDIARILSVILKENIDVQGVYNEKEDKKVTLKERFLSGGKKFSRIVYYLVISLFLFIDVLMIVILTKEIFTYKALINNQNYSAEIINNSDFPLKVKDTVIDKGGKGFAEFTFGEKITINDNKGEVILKTPFEIYSIKLENFEVILKDGNNKGS